ncbi:MAG: M23/M56 family metallopeptidase, partial [Pseudomonadota bacterium]
PVGQSKQIAEPLRKTLLAIQHQYKLPIFVTTESVSPFVCYLPCRALVLPAWVLKHCNDEQWRLILRHELTHLKKHDPQVLLSAQLLGCFSWFNPAANWLQRKIELAIELECDALVLKQYPHSRRPDSRSVYAQTMLETLRQCAVIERNSITAPFPPKNQRSFRMRINYIMHPAKVIGKSWRAKAGLLGLLLGTSSLSIAVKPEPTSLSMATGENAAIAMVPPVKQPRISSNYGMRIIAGKEKFHMGIDYKAPIGTPVYAALSGRVILSADSYKGNKNYGKVIVLEHSNNLKTLYSHLSERNVSKGEQVSAGQIIAAVGMTGKTTGPHVHFEVRESDKPVDPAQYLAE